jgi:hypothetical protein
VIFGLAYVVSKKLTWIGLYVTSQNLNSLLATNATNGLFSFFDFVNGEFF